MWKIDQWSRMEIAKKIWDLFILHATKVKVHYGKRAVFIVVQLDSDVDTDRVTEATLTDRRDGYSELTNVPFNRDGD